MITQNLFMRRAVKMLILHNLLYIPEPANTLMTEKHGGSHAALFEMTHGKQSTANAHAPNKINKTYTRNHAAHTRFVHRWDKWKGLQTTAATA